MKSENTLELRKLSELVELTGTEGDLSKLWAELSFLARTSAALSPEAVLALARIHPVVVGRTEEGLCVVAGRRTLALAIGVLAPSTAIQTINVGKISKIEQSELELTDVVLSELFFCLSVGSVKKLQRIFSVLPKELAAQLKELLPGATSQAALARLTGVREGTIYAGNREGEEGE